MVERKEIRKEMTHAYENIYPLFLKGDFTSVNELYQNTDVYITTNATLVSMMSMMMRWKKYLNQEIVADFYHRTRVRFLEQFTKEEVESIFEGWEC